GFPARLAGAWHVRLSGADDRRRRLALRRCARDPASVGTAAFAGRGVRLAYPEPAAIHHLRARRLWREQAALLAGQGRRFLSQLCLLPAQRRDLFRSPDGPARLSPQRGRRSARIEGPRRWPWWRNLFGKAW